MASKAAVAAFVHRRQRAAAKKNAQTGVISGGVTVAPTPYMAGEDGPGVPGGGVATKSATRAEVYNQDTQTEIDGSPILVQPETPAPGDGAQGDVGNGKSVAEGGGIPGLGLSVSQLLSIYDRVNQRSNAPTPVAPGASSGRANRPEPVPSKTQTPSPPPAGSRTPMILVALVVGLLIGWLLGKLIGALLVGAVFAILAYMFI